MRNLSWAPGTPSAYLASSCDGANNTGNGPGCGSGNNGIGSPKVCSSTDNNAFLVCSSSRPCPGPKTPCIRCGNLVQNPSFEEGYNYWSTNNVYIGNTYVFEGTALASMGTGVASFYQDLNLHGVTGIPLFFSFNALGGNESSFNGTLTAQIVWLDKAYNQIGVGLRMFIPDGRITANARITFFALTDRVPANAVFARISISKAQGTFADYILIDEVVMAPITGQDLLVNGDFEAGLLGWTADPNTAFISDHKLSLEGAGHVRTHFNGTLSQDVYIRNLPKGSPFLFSFAVGGLGPVSINVRIEWLDINRNPIGSGLNLQIPDGTLPVQGNYLSYLNLTEPAIRGTAFARIIFSANVPNPGYYLLLDQVLFTRAVTDNLITNPSFENGLNDWDDTYVTLVQLNDVYEGTADAGLGQIGGALVQNVNLGQAPGHCYLFSTGLGFRRTTAEATFGTMLMKVIWLDNDGHEIGLGLCLIGTSSNQIDTYHQWVPYVGITEPAPPGTAAARIQFTKTESTDGYIEIDNVVFGRLI